MTQSAPAMSKAKLEHYREHGYVVVEDLVPAEEVRQLLQRMDDYINERRKLSSVRIQIEPKVARGEVVVEDRRQAIRALEGTVPGDDLFTALVLKPRLVAAIQAILGPDIKLFREKALLKPAKVGSAKGVHQDSPYWPIEPYELASCWIAFDPATRTNGCMTALSGSHKKGGLPHISVPDDFVIDPACYNAADLVPVEMDAGAGMFFHSLLVHGTAPNTSSNPRRAITLSYMAAASRYTGKTPKPDYFRIAGKDVEGGV